MNVPPSNEELPTSQPSPFNDLMFVAVWLNLPQVTLGQFAHEVEQFLAALLGLHPAFGGLHLVGDSKKDSPKLATDLSNLQEWVLRKTWNKDAPSNARYSNQRRDGSLTPLSRGDLGFDLYLSNLKAAPERLKVVIANGAPERGGLQITIPDPLTHELTRTEFLIRLIELTRSIWPIRYAELYSLNWDDLVNSASSKQNVLPIGGINFNSDETLVNALPAGTSWQTLPSGGVLFTVTPRPDQLDPEAIAKAVAIRVALDGQGMLAVR